MVSLANNDDPNDTPELIEIKNDSFDSLGKTMESLTSVDKMMESLTSEDRVVGSPVNRNRMIPSSKNRDNVMPSTNNEDTTNPPELAKIKNDSLDSLDKLIESLTSVDRIMGSPISRDRMEETTKSREGMGITSKRNDNMVDPPKDMNKPIDMTVYKAEVSDTLKDLEKLQHSPKSEKTLRASASTNMKKLMHKSDPYHLDHSLESRIKIMESPGGTDKMGDSPKIIEIHAASSSITERHAQSSQILETDGPGTSVIFRKVCFHLVFYSYTYYIVLLVLVLEPVAIVFEMTLKFQLHDMHSSRIKFIYCILICQLLWCQHNIIFKHKHKLLFHSHGFLKVCDGCL